LIQLITKKGHVNHCSPKEEIASQKRHLLSFLCIDYTTFNAKITIFYICSLNRCLESIG
jgi:hypothetical protein